MNKGLHYVDAWGLPKGGHFKAGSKWYYTVKGRIRTGWNTGKNGTKYYVEKSGALATGARTIKGKKYSFDATGALRGSRVTVMMNGRRYTDAIEDIVVRMVAAEVEMFANDEVYKAQAVAARSYLEYLLADGETPSVVGKVPSSRVRKAVKEVENLHLTYGGKPAFTPYGSSSNGKTNPGKSFFQGSFPYLKSRTSKYDSNAPKFKVTTKVPLDDFRAAMDKTYGKNAYTLPDNPAEWVKVTYNAVGYAIGRVVLGNKTPKVEYFYQTFMRLCIPDGLRSPSFQVTYLPGEEALQFTTRGWGHGVGLSQYGAYYYAKNNRWNYKRILNHYFPGTKLCKA